MSEHMDVGRTHGSLLLALAALLALLALAAAPAGAQAARLYVSLTFDDGTGTQYDFRDVLNDRGVRGTYYANSGKVGLPGYMTWSQLQEMQGEGHEIGGHTVDHRALPPLTREEQIEQVCDDRFALLLNGLDATSFAYPHGAYDAQAMEVVEGCGYDSGRTTGAIDFPPDCCVYANPVPLDRVYDARAVQPSFNVTLEDYRAVIERGRDFGGGWLPIVFHDICAAPCDGIGPGDYYVSDDLLDELIGWMQADPELRIRTTAQVTAISRDLTPPVTQLTAPADGATVVQGETVGLQATATDAVGVERVDFYADGQLVGSDDAAPYAVDWVPAQLGSAQLHTVAHDEAGHSGRSPTVGVTVVEPDTTPPTVALVAPADHAVVSGYVALAATASDARSAIDRVEFLVDGEVVDTDRSPPYLSAWDATQAAPGTTVAIAARAHDAAGNSATSPVRTVTVASRREPDPPRPPDPDPPRPPDPDPPTPPQPDPPRPPQPDPPRPPQPDPDPPQPPRDAAGPRLVVKATVGRGRRLVVRVLATDPSGVGPIRLLINGRTVRTGVRLSGTHTPTARLVRSLRERPGRYVIRAVATDGRGNRTESRPVRVVVRR